MPIKINLHDSTSLIEATPSSSTIVDKRLEALLKEEIEHRIEGDAYLQQQIDEIIAGGACFLLIEEKDDGSIDISLLDKDDHKLSTQTIHLTEKLIKGVTLDSVEGKLVFTHLDDTTLECDISGIFDAIDAERSRAESAEAQLSQAISNEASARVSGDEALNTLLEIERDNRLNIDEQLQQNIDELSDDISDVSGELSSRIDSVEEDLTNRIVNEIDRATEKEADLQGEIDDINQDLSDLHDALDEESESRQTEDAYLQDQIWEETSRAEGVEADLQSQIDNIDSGVDAERDRAEAAEQALQDAIDAEESARISADEALDTNISTESARAIAKENEIADNLATEITNRVNADSALDARVSAIEQGQYVYRSDIVDNLTTNDPNKVLSANQGKILKDSLDTEISTRTSEVETLTTAISTESTRAQGVESGLQTQIDNRYTKTQTDTLLDTKQNVIDSSHKLASDLVDDTNQTHKFATSEQLAQIATNTQAISDEESRATNAESSLSDDITNETTRAQGAEEALGARIDDLDLSQVGASGSYIKLVSQANGQVNASAQAFDTSLTNATDDNAPTSKTVKDYVDSFGGKIDSISINGVNQPIVNKNVDLPAYPTKASLGLDNVDNTSDLNKPISTATQAALDLKANQATTYTKTEDDALLATKQDVIDASHKLSADLVDDSETTHKFVDESILSDIASNTSARHTHSNKAILDATTASFTTEEETKLSGIAAGAQVNVLEGVQVNGSDLTITNKKVNVIVPTKTSDITNDSGFITKSVDNLDNYSLTSEFDDVAFSGDYDDLSNTPTIGDATLTIQKNGVTIDTFSANATSNKTVNVVVPTKTSDINNDSDFTTNAYVNGELAKKVDKVNGYGLSQNDFTDALKTKLDGIEIGADVNVIEGVQVNGTDLTPDANKKVNVTVPTKVSQLTNDGDGTSGSEFITNSELETALDDKVDKEEGMGLSHNDFTDALKTKLEGIEPGGEVNTIETISVNGSEITPDANRNVDITVPTKTSDLNNDSDFTTKTYVDSTFVEKVQGKGLSTEDFTTALKTKLEGVESGAEVNIIEDVKVNGTSLTITNKSVDVTVPTKVSELVNDGDGTSGSEFITNSELVTELNTKVDKVEGKGLSTNDYTTAEKNKLSGIATGAQVNVIETVKVDGTALTVTDKAVDIDLSGKVDKVQGKGLSTNDFTDSYKSQLDNLSTDLDGKVDKVSGYGLSQNDFTDALKTKLDGIAVGAEVNVQSDWNVTDTTSDAFIKNKPSIYTTTETDTLLSGKQNVIDSTHKLDADLVDDSTSTNKFVNASILSDISSNTSARHTHSNKAILDATTASFTTAQETKLSGIETGAEVNIIEDIKVNGTSQTITSKSVDIDVPTKTSDLTNDGDGTSAFATESYVDTYGGKIDSISVNGVEQTIDEDKNVDITVPTKVSDLNNDSGFISGVAWGDITGTLSNQSDLNTALGNKVDKVSSANKVYATDSNSAQTSITYASTDTASTIVQRDANKQINIAQTPTADSHAASKKYVDTAISGVSSDISDVSSALSTHTGNTSNPHSVTASQVGLGSVVNTGDSATPVENGTTKFTTGGAYTLQSTLQGNITTVDNKLDVNVHVEGSSDEISYNGDTVTKTSPYKNLKTGTTGSRSEVIQLANSTNAGLMSHSDYNQIRDLTDRVDALEGQTKRLLYTDSTSPTQQDIQDFVDEYLESIGITTPTADDYMGIAVVVAGTYHIWHYYTEDGWRDDGTDTVTQFTNSTAGVIKGKATDGFVYAENDGTGSVYGWDALKTRVTNVETGMVSNVSYDTTNKKITKTINGVTSDVVSASTLKTDMSLNNVENGAQVNTIESISINGTTQTITSKNVDLPAYPTKSSWNYDDTYVKYSAAQSLTDAQKTTAKINIGLGNVDNTSDATKKTNFTGSIADDDTGFVLGGDVYDALSGKVDKVNGKGLSTNDFTDAFETKLTNIESGAQVNVIEDVKVNGTSLTVTNKSVDITVPTPSDATITIKQTGISDQTFTLNGSAKTITLADNNTTYTFAEGTTNGAFSVTPSGGSAQNVSIHGLGSNAYTSTPIPTTYLESASASGNTLTITPSSGSAITFTPTFTDTNQKIKTSSVTFGADDVVQFNGGGNITITGNASDKTMTLGVASGYSIPSTTKQNEWDAKANTSDIPSTYIVSGSVNGNTLTLTNADTTSTTFTPSFTDTNQKVKVGNVTFGNDDVVSFVGGGDISVAGDASAKTITISATLPTVNNGTLTIQKNGTSVTTFSANQSGNATANITTPETIDVSNGVNETIKNKIIANPNCALKYGDYIYMPQYDGDIPGLPTYYNCFEGDGNLFHWLQIDWTEYEVTHDTMTYISSHQSIKTLDTTATTAQSTSASESITGNGTITLHKVSKTGNYNDLLNKPTIPTVNNATLTITQNSTSIGTFTANASTNVTIDVVTPQVQRFI